ncbi:MAG: glycosyltransferase [Nitrosomonadaceae bacterium]|nr:glycosyltransferase [Nitrosospira sp.]MDW7598173.1 glycosyltransferase [Nitrosomonadaceae bacterium]MBI0409340.1 glycosyltransferase [Nitrosospira sp.]MBI0410034.1 glycosyltransferase [Nitrosospira sp.]MBI0411606.1 glycosyltransferase [Nitrosospira sp.]
MVDDGSKDGTPDKVCAWERRSPVRLIERREKPDLTASIWAGVAVSQVEVIVVMDADLSYPSERLARDVLMKIGNYAITAKKLVGRVSAA